MISAHFMYKHVKIAQFSQKLKLLAVDTGPLSYYSLSQILLSLFALNVYSSCFI
jgi:hypothetical protein